MGPFGLPSTTLIVPLLPLRRCRRLYACLIHPMRGESPALVGAEVGVGSGMGRRMKAALRRVVLLVRVGSHWPWRQPEAGDSASRCAQQGFRGLVSRRGRELAGRQGWLHYCASAVRTL
jgi:hypothetical protein